MSLLLGCVDTEGRLLENEHSCTVIARIIESEEIGLMIQAFDDDGDGEIDYNEFLVLQNPC